jgi:hypothetical protein
MSTPTTPTASNLISETAERYRARLEELEPYVIEHAQLEHGLKSIDPEFQPRNGTVVVHRAARGARKESFLNILQQNPQGLRISEITRLMEDAPNQSALYSVGNKLVDEGLVTKVDNRYYLAEQLLEQPEAQESPAAA